MFKKSKSEKYNNKKSRQRKLNAFELSAFVMMLLSLFAGMAFLASGCFSFLRSENSSSSFSARYSLLHFLYLPSFFLLFSPI